MLRLLLLGSLLVWTVSAGPLGDSPGRVVNGTDAEIESYPYMVSLRGSTGSHSCGATIISPDWVLTAAHCVGSDPTAYSIQYSSTNISPSGPNIAYISQIIRHEAYNPGLQYINDVAVLRLATPVHLRQYVALPAPFTGTMGGTGGTLVGWGLDQTGGSIQVHLQRVDLYVYSHAECSSIHYAPVYPSNICAGVPGGGMGQCSGDSGGPLLVYGTIVGIVSWSVKPCTIAPYPGVYTRVSYYRDWIQVQTGI